MPKTLVCPSCRALVDIPNDRLDRPGECPYCRTALPAEEFNPYRAPEAELAPSVTDEASRPIPASPAGKVVDAFRLLFSNLPLLAAIVLTVWLPESIVDVAVDRSVATRAAEMQGLTTFQVTSIIEGIFGPIYVGALVYALGQLKRGTRRFPTARRCP